MAQTDTGGALKFDYDRYFTQWLKENRVSFVISSYKTGHVFTIGLASVTANNTRHDRVSLYITNMQRPMGISAAPDRIWLSSDGQIWSFPNQGSEPHTDAVADGVSVSDYDASYTPRQIFNVNDLDVHDMIVNPQTQGIVFCSSLFSCLCEPSLTASFRVYWKPPWVSKIAAEDRCHLNGVCERDGVVRYVTAISQTDVKDGWREHRDGGGVVYDIVEDRVVCSGLSMPHSPRWAHGKLWVLESGTGHLGYVVNNAFEKKVFVPGYLRGLCFINKRYAVVTCSQDRHDNMFQGLALGKALEKLKITARCGLFIIDLDTYDLVHHLTFAEPIVELYDVGVLRNVVRAKIDDINDQRILRKYKIEQQTRPPRETRVVHTDSQQADNDDDEDDDDVLNPVPLRVANIDVLEGNAERT